MYIVGRIADQAIIATRNGIVDEIGRDFIADTNEVLNITAQNFGGAPADYVVYRLDDTTEVPRYRDGDGWLATWTSDAITAVSFDVEDAKWIADFSLDKDTINGDGVDTAVMTLTVYLADGVTVSTLNANRIIPILKDGGVLYTLMDLTAGVATVSVKRLGGGSYQFPGSKDIGIPTVRVRTAAKLTVLEMF